MIPLNALRAFEAAARTGSFTKAARELRVSSAAISQQVKLLEEFWRETLFIRQGNRISLTDSGQTAYPQIAHAMSSLNAMSDKMRRREPGQRRLTLSAPQSIAETWLAPRLAQLDLDEAIPLLSIRVDDDPIDLVNEKVDVRIFYGHDLYTEYHIEPLFTDNLIAVASPDFAARHAHRLAEVTDQGFIHTDWGRGLASSPDWGTALRGLRTIDRNLGLLVQSSSTALNFARHGMGVALIPSMMAEDDLAAHRIAKMDLVPRDLKAAYCAAFSKRLGSRPAVQAIINALRDGHDARLVRS